MSILLAHAIVFASLAPRPASTLKIEINYSETANLAYQLDVVSGSLGHVDPTDFQTLWKREFLKTKQDEEFVNRWAALKRRYSTSAQLPGIDMPFEASMQSVSIFDNIRVASLRAKNPREFLDGAALLMIPADAAKLGEVLRYFSPRFHLWWQRDAAVKGRGFVRNVERLLKSPAVGQQIARFRTFYSPTLPEGSSVFFSFIYRPNLVKAPTNGQQIGNVGLAEFFSDETPEKRLDVVLHEFCHFLYTSRSDADNLAFQNAFASSSDPAAKPSYNLFNEGMATALGNGIIGRQFRPTKDWQPFLDRPLSLYNNPNIDRAGKRLLRLMDEWLPTGRPMTDPAFVPAYLSAMKEAFGPDLTRPSLYLNEAFIYVDEKFGMAFAQKARKSLAIGSAYMSVSNLVDAGIREGYERQASLSALFVVPPSQVDALVEQNVISSAEAAAIKDELATNKSALLGHPRSPHAYTFLVVADDSDEASREITRIASAPKLFSGVLPR